MKRLSFLLPALWMPFAIWAIEDTPANREAQADRYLAAMPVSEMMQSLAEQMAPPGDADQRRQFVEAMTARLDIEKVARVMREALVRVYTADELCALADFYSSPAGRSATRKMGDYLAVVMPRLQEEIRKAQSKGRR